ncbi:MAG: MBL fold metallo-hydrolase [Lachnospiraceae bacterium]
MKITYIYHSAFLVETKQQYLLFDYVKGNLPELNPEKMLTVFVSHAHEDHFDPVIFRLAERLEHNPNKIRYVLSYNLERKTRVMHLEEIMVPLQNRIFYLRFGASLSLPGLLVEAVKSTDQGVAFLVQADGKWMFHSGDLYEWVWEEEDKSRKNDMRARYRREIDALKDRCVYAAFVPLDPHLEEHYGDGFSYFIKTVQPDYIFPMHMWDRYEIQEQWARENGAKECAPEKGEKNGAKECAPEKGEKNGAKECAPEVGAQKGAKEQGLQEMWLAGSSKVARVFHAGQEWELPESFSVLSE